MAVASRVTDSSLRQVLVLLGPAMKMPPAVSLGQRHTAAKRIAENPVATSLAYHLESMLLEHPLDLPRG